MTTSKATGRVLVLSLDALGDLTLRQPMIAGLLDAGWRVSVAVRPVCRYLTAALDPRLQRIVAEVDPYRPDAPRELLEALRKVLEEIRAWQPDVVISPLFNRTFADEWILRSLRGVRRIGLFPGADPRSELETHFPALAAGLPLAHAELLTEPVSVSEDSHECDKAKALFDALAAGGRYPDIPRLSLTPGMRGKRADFLRAIGVRPGKYAVVSCGSSAGGPRKAITLDQAVRIIRRLEGHGLTSVLVGTASERSEIDRVLQATAQIGLNARPWIGSPEDFESLLAITESARLYAGCDTGPMHFAAALGLPVMAIVGGGTYPRFLPRSLVARVLTQRIPCFGCGWKCPFEGSLCIELVEPGAIDAAIDDLVGGKGGFVVDEGGKSLGSASVFLDRYAMAVIRRAGQSPGDSPVVAQLRGERNLLAAQLADVRRQFESAEADRAARLKVIEQQGRILADLHAQIDARLKELEALHEKAEVARNERNLLAAQLADVRSQFESAEADRAARLQVIEEQGRVLADLHAQMDARLKELEALYEEVEATRNERNLRAAQLAEVRSQFESAEGDRAARLKVIEEQGRMLADLHAQMDARLKEIEALHENMEAARNERNLLAAQLADVRSQFESAEADRAARLKVIEEQGRRVVELEAAVFLTEQNRDWHRDESARLGAELEASLQSLRREIERLQRDDSERDHVAAQIQGRWWYRLGRKLNLL